MEKIDLYNFMVRTFAAMHLHEEDDNAFIRVIDDMQAAMEKEMGITEEQAEFMRDKACDLVWTMEVDAKGKSEQ